MVALKTIRGLALMPLYDWPEYHGETDALWDRVRGAARDEGLDLPPALEHRNHSISAWMDEGLVFSQLCGSPWYRHHRSKARYLASSVLALEGAPAGRYFSHVIVRADSNLNSLDDIEQAGDARFAFNEPDSQSGVHCLRARFDMDAQLASGLHSGGHRHSIDAVLAGDADFAAIDACSFRLYAGLFSGPLGRAADHCPDPAAARTCADYLSDAGWRCCRTPAAVRADRLGRPGLRRRWQRSAGSRGALCLRRRGVPRRRGLRGVRRRRARAAARSSPQSQPEPDPAR